VDRPKASSPEALRRMKSLRQRDTKPEVVLRKHLHAMGYRYRVDRAPISGMRTRADLVFGPARLAVFVDGCFWHACPEHATWPKANADWWRKKIEANVERDRRVDRELHEAGWDVVRVWEHEDPAAAARTVAERVDARRRCR
jgi:DNA mismatch endonuclease, patch repair protein